jgi:uncharacterized protein with HEPN domain
MTAQAICDRPVTQDVARVWRILHAGEKLLNLTREISRSEYVADELRQLACERLMITIGQAAAQISPEFRRRHARVPWLDMIALGHRLVHEEEHVSPDETWMIARGRIGGWIRAIEPLIS